LTNALGIPAGIMPDYRREIPGPLLERTGKWVEHRHMQPGVFRHLADDGFECISVRLLLPPGGFLSSNTLRLLARWIREYALTGRRTSRQGFELVGVPPSRLAELLDEVAAHGLAVGGTANSLHQPKCCNGFIHCQNAVIDAPSILKMVMDRLFDGVQHHNYPAGLKISAAGCPNQCGGGIEADIGILGVFLDGPRVSDERLIRSGINVEYLRSHCPVGALHRRELPDGVSVQVDLDLCVRCTSCLLTAPEAIEMGVIRGAAIAVGGRGGGIKGTPRLARVLHHYIPAIPLNYDDLIGKIEFLVDRWCARAVPGERIGDFLDRIGWDYFRQELE